MKSNHKTLTLTLVGLLVLAFTAICCHQNGLEPVEKRAGNASGFASPSAQCPNPPTPTISADLPTDVCIPSDFTGLPIQFFDDYSWRSFIAMVWPAKSGQRGVADTTKSVGDANSRVFETFKTDWEVFQPGGAAPSAWDSLAGTNPCSLTTVGPDDLVLASFSKFDNVAQAGFQELVGPLVAQNGTYVRHLTGFNRIEFTDILSKQLYLQANLNNVTLSQAALDVKSAWIAMKGVAHPERYYVHKQAWVFDLEAGKCLQRDVGLVALHIVQKTPSRPQWIWSTFEQVDNIPQTGANAPFSFHDGSATPMPSPPNPITFPPPAVSLLKFNVTRRMPIESSTQTTNAAYQAVLRTNGGGVWQFYQLVMTQWPLQLNPPQPIPPSQNGKPGNTFPGTGATTSFSNVAMETFFQDSILSGCMNCHDKTRVSSDFVWALKMHAFDPSNPFSPPSLPPVLSGPAGLQHVKLSPEIQDMRELMQQVAATKGKPK